MNGIEHVFLETVALSWRAAWLILLLVAARLVLRRHVAPGMLFAGWLLVAGMLLMPLRLPVPWDPLGLGQAAKLRPAALPLPAVDADAPGVLDEQQAGVAYPLGSVDPEIAARQATELINFDVFEVSVSTSRSLVGSAALIWLAGAAGLLLLRGIAVMRLRRKLVRTRLRVDRRIAAAVVQGCATLGIPRTPEIVVTSMVGTPALWGIFRPQLLFPAGFADRLSADELRWVVQHELAHLRRRDLLAQTFLQAACIVHWFNPLVWLAARLARHDCELACDAFVLRHAKADDGGDYGRTLLKVLGRASGGNRLPNAVGIVEGKRLLLKRITRIADYRRGHLRPVLVGAMLVGGFVFVGYTAPESRRVEKPAVESVPVTDPVAPALRPPANRLSTEMQAKLAARRAETEAKQRAMKFDLRAVGEVGGVPVALMDVNGEPTLVIQGSRILAYGVQAIDPQRKELVLRYRDEPVRVLTITDPRPVEFPEIPPERVEQMLRNPAYLDNLSAYNRSIPAAVIQAWGSIRRDAKESILLNYLRSGFVMTYVFQDNTISASPRRLFEPEIRETRNNRRLAFIESLSPQQQADYAGGLQSVINITAPREVQEAQAAAGKERAERQAKVIENLTADQRALYEAIPAGQKP